MIRQPFHVVDQSPWPFLTAVSVMALMSGAGAWMYHFSIIFMLVGLLSTMICSFSWWRDIIRESAYMGYHNTYTSANHRWAMIMFILSEVLFFISFFWGFFHSSLAPTPEIGCCWPPTGITVLNPFAIPLLNTMILLSSGFSVTWAHHSLIANSRSQAMQGLLVTVLLGAYFTTLQVDEYFETTFSISDSVYGTLFFVCTGFHGLHVLIGTMFLGVALMRIYLHQFSNLHHFGFEAAAWYWHFVDVVWICLYLLIYWWGS
uniref:Cytochrome c oxidase subunit 3 n=1 Tax=Osedax rubiplumus TaxID=283784 RepID=A0A6M4AIK1_OSERU|nr:cytochrome c oxidase subunit 3 [Osedax rubiplumus]QJQ26888.1 cytochrome c oxidase subunit 3 [Osedax rubiplumus]